MTATNRSKQVICYDKILTTRIALVVSLFETCDFLFLNYTKAYSKLGQ